MDLLTGSTHLHITTWVVGIVLFLIAALSGNKSKGLHMLLRLFYILIIITGGALFMEWRSKLDDAGMNYDIKVLMAILVIGFMEMILVRKRKGKSVTVFWGLFAVTLFVTLFLGLSKGIGMNF